MALISVELTPNDIKMLMFGLDDSDLFFKLMEVLEDFYRRDQ